MTDKHDYTASIRGKGCDQTGITEGIAQEMYATLGRRTLGIIELKHARQINDDDTGRKVELVITALEPSTNAELDDHLRELMRTLHHNRALKSEDDQLQIDTLDDVEPTVDQVIAAGQAHVAETDDELPDPEESTVDDEPGPTEPATPDDLAFEPHDFVHGVDGEDIDGDHCTYHGCGAYRYAAIHTGDRETAEAPA